MMSANKPTKKFIQDVLILHNKYRSVHSSPDLKINDKLNELAQDWAENLAKKEVMEHRPDNDYGENIYLASNSDPKWELKPENVVDAWYAEIEMYKFGEESPTNLPDVGHFTQLVWHSTETMGLGMATSETGKVIVVCNYEPAGNVLRKFTDNVYPVKKVNKTEDNTENSIGDEVKPGEIVDQILGIPIEIPNKETLESMARLYAVPSEKLRVLTSWLIKVTEEANAWQSWLHSHIDLILRMSEYFIPGQQQQQSLSSKNTIDEKTASNSTFILNSSDISSMKKLEDETVSAGEPKDIPQSFSKFDKTHEKKEDKKLEEISKHSVENHSMDGGTSSELSNEKIVKNTWPIGIPWSPRLPDKKNKKTKKFEDKIEFEPIPMPRDEIEMAILIKQVKHQAKIYRSLYKHWKETADRAYQEIIDRDIMPTNQVFNDEEVPYSYYVYTDINDDDEINSTKNTTEQLTHNNQHLYFNISDKYDL
ncbi:uncharacterized protein LOC122859390 isoform X2 [Aphidius gifuensis]|uniref:uncharacterized protein LOC122859390 isoform X2 n=1 Tax=Aphidius gifuensis TaxID=684658 RepID=UPI001CDBA0D9|nr:uncharacterized protein LOC122859390 isoform X2 [Aphidius gifuensis]